MKNIVVLTSYWLLLASFIPTEAFAATPYTPPPALISVRGEGSVEVAPDMATITIGVTCQGKTARVALTKNTQDMNSILAEMKGQGIEEKDLQTSNFRLSPVYDHNERQVPPPITGYQVANDLTIRIRDLKSAGQVLDTAISLGGNRVVDGIVFGHSNTKDSLQQARIAAVRDARLRAETIVSELGVSLGDIDSIVEGEAVVPERGMHPGIVKEFMSLSMSSGRRHAPVPLASGESTYRVTVNINWRIIQEKSSSTC